VPAATAQVQANLDALKANLRAKGKMIVQRQATAQPSMGVPSITQPEFDGDGFDMVFSARGTNGMLVFFSPSKTPTPSDSWEIGFQHMGRSYIKSNGIELASYIDTVSMGVANWRTDNWRDFYISFDEDDKTLSVWNDVHANGDAPILVAKVDKLSSTTLIPSFAAYDTPIVFSLPEYVDIPDNYDWTAQRVTTSAGAMAAVPSDTPSPSTINASIYKDN